VFRGAHMEHQPDVPPSAATPNAKEVGCAVQTVVRAVAVWHMQSLLQKAIKPHVCCAHVLHVRRMLLRAGRPAGGAWPDQIYI
jgi:hypothetical protein